MVKDAEAHAEEDRKRREEAEVRNNADTLVYQTEKVLREQGDKVSADESAAVEGPLGDLKTALDGQRQRGHQGRHRDADDRQPGVQPEAVRGGRPRRQRRRHVGPRPGRRLGRTTTTSSTPRSSTTSDGADRMTDADDDAVDPTSTADEVEDYTGGIRRPTAAAAAVAREPTASATVTSRRRRRRRGRRARRRRRWWPSATSSRTSRCACRPTSRTTASASPAQHGRRGRPGHRPHRRGAAARARRVRGGVLRTASTSIEPIWSTLSARCSKQGLEALDLDGKPFDPERRRGGGARAGRWRRGRSWPRCCAPGTGGKGARCAPRWSDEGLTQSASGSPRDRVRR